MKAKVVIVGGGVMGVAIAWYAARRAREGESVVLLEKKELAAGSSGRSGAILRQHYSDRVVAAMARDSLKVYAGIEANTGRSIGFQACGVITLAGPTKPDQVALIERNIAMQVEIGIDTRRVDAREIRELVPGIQVADGTIGAYEPTAGGVDPVRTVEAIAALAREQGATTRIGTKVTGFIVEGGRIRGVETEDGLIHAEQVVVAAGPWTRALMLEVGVDLPMQVLRPEQHFLKTPSARRDGPTSKHNAPTAKQDVSQVRPTSQHVGHIGAPHEFDLPFARETALPPAAHPVMLDLELGFYTRCESHASRTRVGRMDYHGEHVVEDPDAIDEDVSPEFKRWAREKLERRMPVYRAQPDTGSIVGMYTVTPDAQALIGPCRGIEGLYVVSGFSGHGFKLAPSIGEGVTQMLWNEPVSAFDLEFFDPYRFEIAAREREQRAFGL